MENNKDDMKLLLKQPYFVTMAKYDFNVHESRVFLTLMKALQPKMIYDKSPIQVNNDDLGHLEIKIKTKDLVKSGNYDDVRRALKHLTKKEIIVEERGEDGKITSELFTNLLMAGELEHRSSTCYLTLHKKIVPHLIALDKNYTQYLYEPAFNSSSPNTMKLYMMCSHFKDKKQINVKLETLKNLLRIDKKYNRVFDVKRRILEPAMRELKEKADVWFDIAERIKDGRRMIGWKFNIYTKEPQKASKALPKAIQTAVPINGPKPPNPEYLETELMLNKQQAQKIVDFFSRTTSAKQKKLRRIFQEIQWAMLDKKIHTSLGGYVTKTINQTFKGDLKI